MDPRKAPSDVVSPSERDNENGQFRGVWLELHLIYISTDFVL